MDDAHRATTAPRPASHLWTRALWIAGVACLPAADALAAEGGLVLVPSLELLLGLLAFFVVLVFPVNALLFRPVFAILDAREERIAGTRDRADKLATQAEKSLIEYEDKIREVREEAEEQRKSQLLETRSAAQQETQSARAGAETQIDDARRQIAEELEAARGSLRPRAEELAREAATRVLGRSL